MKALACTAPLHQLDSRKTRLDWRAPQGVLLRDSKDRTGPALTVPNPAWRAFLAPLTP